MNFGDSFFVIPAAFAATEIASFRLGPELMPPVLDGKTPRAAAWGACRRARLI
jgi:hypothetical protein